MPFFPYFQLKKHLKMKYIPFLLLLFIGFACQKEQISLGTNVHDNFFLQNKGASMPVRVFGNTASKTFMMIIHGGPGGDAIVYRSDYVKQNVENQCAVVYWDQRNAGASQGGANGGSFKVENFIEDFEQVIGLLKQRYGSDIAIFVNGHSWGGYLTPAFLTTRNNQNLVKGWIQTDGAHNFPLLNKYSKEMLLDKAEIEIAANKNVSKWTEIRNYCNALTLPLDVYQWNDFNGYGTQAMGITTESNTSGTSPSPRQRYLDNNAPLLTIFLQGLYNPVTFDMMKDTYAKAPTISNLSVIKIPTLLLFGKYDYICPPKLADDIESIIQSKYKKKVIFQKSSHSPMVGVEEPAYWTEIMQFINNFK
jgi:pimeloyl-ACP methyl ester carboxylesterase